MKAFMRTVVLSVLSLSLPFSIAAQAWDLNLSGAGARAEGLGQAFTSIADDATALVWNPGGLTTLQKPEASVVTKVLFSENRNFSTMPVSNDNC